MYVGSNRRRRRPKRDRRREGGGYGLAVLAIALWLIGGGTIIPAIAFGAFVLVVAWFEVRAKR